MDEIFPRCPETPLEIDLGCGDGTFLLNMARAFPERNFLATEKLMGRVRRVVNKIVHSGLTNVRIVRTENAHTLGWNLPTAGIDRLHLLFPDPWPKARHEERRLFRRPDFLRGMQRAFRQGAELVFKSDQPDLFDEMTATMTEQPGWQRLDGVRNEIYAETDFERLWKTHGRTIYAGRWQRTVH